MRIAYLISQYPAASHTFIRREIEELRKQGLQIETFSIRQPSPDERTTPQDRAGFADTYYVLPPSFVTLIKAHLTAIARRPIAYLGTLRLALIHRAPGMRALLWALFHFAESIVVADELKRRGIDRLHNHFANAAANVGLLAANFTGVPWSLTLHGISETDYPAGLLLAKKVEAAQFVACVSWFGRAQAMRITPPGHWPKFLIVRCGLDMSCLPARISSGPPPRLICVGRLSAEKGQIGLLEAFSEVRDRGIATQLVLVGDGPERELIERRCAALGLEHLVSFKGRLDEPATLAEIACADLLVVPSFMEGLPVVLMEAMALGVPVVASRVAGVPELIEDGQEGLLFRPGDWGDLSDKLALLLSDDALRERISAAARAKVQKEFEIAVAVGPLIRRFAASSFQADMTPVHRRQVP